MPAIGVHNSPAAQIVGHHGVNFTRPSVIGGIQPPQQWYHSPSTYPPPPYDANLPPIPPKNEKELTREALIQVLEHFSLLIAQHFPGRPIRLVVHGGACMLLHPGLYALSLQQHQMSPHLPRRTSTRDVDYIHRSFVSEMAGVGMHDAAARLAECIKGAAMACGLGLDWMNSDADIALPYATDPSGIHYDPIYLSSVQRNNIDLHTIFTAPNKMLTLISVTPFWAVSLKLVRYIRWDPGDICLLLRNGVILSGTHWTPEQLESWLYTECWSMGYAHFDAMKEQQLRDRIVDAIHQLKFWNESVGVDEGHDRIKRSRDKEKEDKDRSVIPPAMGWAGRTVSAHDAMGGGEVVGGGASALSSGWSAGVGGWPGKPTRDHGVVSPPPAYHNKGWNVMDWASGKYSPSGPARGSGSGSDREKTKKARSRSLARAQSPSRTKSGQRDEIFIPNLDSDEEEDGWIHVEGSGDPSRGRSPQPIPGRMGMSGQVYPQPQWVHLNPNHGPNVNRPSSRQLSPSQYNDIYGPTKSKVSKAADYGALENFGSVLGASINAYEYGLPYNRRPGHHRISSQPSTEARHNYQVASDATAAHRLFQATKARKKKKKEKIRAKEIGRARSNKWTYKTANANGYLDTESEGESGDCTSDEDADGYGRSQRNEDRQSIMPQERFAPWHNFYDNAGQDNRTAAVSGGAGTLQVPATVRPAGSRPGSRNESSSWQWSKQKKRPPPLNLTPPPGPPANLVSTSQHDAQAANRARPVANGQTYNAGALGPSELAQLQFEQQRKDYQWQLAQQNYQPSMMQVAQQVANQVAAEQDAVAQQTCPHGLRAHASWDHLRPGVNQQQPWYPHQQHHQQRPSNRLRATMTEIYN